MPPKSKFASKGAFDVLATDDGDVDTGHIEDSYEAEQVTSPTPSTPNKPSKAAKRRAAKEKKATAASNGVTDEDLEVMTTRSGRSHPRASTEPREESPNATIQTTPVSQVTIEPSEAKRPKDAESTEIKLGAQKTFLTGKPVGENDKKTNKGNQGDVSERKAFWKKVYERTLFTFLMIGGFIGKNF